MNPIRFALRHPVTVLVLVVALIGTGALALWRTKVDIFPSLNLPVIYVAQPYGGMSPEQMEGLLTNYYEYHFLYIGGIHHVESRNIQSTSLMKLYFHPGTDMAQAMAETITQVNRARAFMPDGTVPPFVMRFDTGSVPVGYLVFSSDNEERTLGQIQDQALFRVRPMFAALPGVSAPPPFGASARAITINVDPNGLRSHGVSAGEVVKCLDANNTISPAGNVRIGDQMPLVPFNGLVTDPQELGKILLKPGVYLKDVLTKEGIKDDTDIATSYALVNGRRAIYIPVNKRAEASTLAVVQAVTDNLGKMQKAVDPDIKVSFEFDQSPTVTRSITSLEHEALLGAILTGLMVLLFLRDWRSVIVVVVNIPLALVGAMVALWLCDQTINLMTLGGLALAVGILVDEATVEVENIHSQMEQGHPVARAVRLGNAETAVPRLLAMLCILAVFIPSFLMEGSLRALFVPLSLAVAFAMVTSYFLSSTLVPVLSVWLLRRRERGAQSAELSSALHSALRAPRLYFRFVRGLTAARWLFIPVYFGVAALVIGSGWLFLGREIFPTVDAGQMQLHLRAPPGTRVERTEELTVRMLDEIKEMVGPDNVQLSLGLVGLVPTSYPINNIFQWMSGPEDSVMRLALKRGSGIRVAELRGRLRRELPGRLRDWLEKKYRAEELPDEEIAERLQGLSVSFEPGDIVNEIMSFGAPTPVEVIVAPGPKYADTRAYAAKLRDRLGKIDTLADLQYGQALVYPTLNVKFDRSRVGPANVSADDIGKTLTTVTSSSRFIVRNYWADPKTGIGYQVQVQVPIKDMSSLEELKHTLIKPAGKGAVLVVNGETPSASASSGWLGQVLLQDVAEVTKGKAAGQYDRYNMRRLVSLTGNVEGEDLGRLEARVRKAIAELKKDDKPPAGVEVDVRGQLETMRQLFAGLGLGLVLAVVVILLLLWAYFQSLRLALVVLATVPAVVAGVALALLATRTTLNLQSFMGAIMSVGVAVANSILLATFAERARRSGLSASDAALDGARHRLRPILMTSCAMIAGMLPIALGLGEGGEQTAPLGRAVIGGLLAATLTTLLVLPGVFALVMGRASVRSASIDPDDPESANYDGVASEPPA